MADKLDVRIKKLEVASELTRIMLKSTIPDKILTNFQAAWDAVNECCPDDDPDDPDEPPSRRTATVQYH